MFLAIPLANKPSWHMPPWMTALLIVINCVVYFGWQVPEESAVERASVTYAKTPLPAIELPAFAQHLKARADLSEKEQDRQQAEMAGEMLQRKAYRMLYQFMRSDDGFYTRLLAGQIIKPDHPDYAVWQKARADFNPREPARFTAHWAQSFEPDAPFRPVTWLTATFLHVGIEHLLGNMVFLFLFGFTLEMALGPWRYLVCYLICGIGGSALAAWAYAGVGSYGLGASGAIAGLMAMYVTLYRLRRIRFFYMLFFYFNYATWPALAVLPVYMGVELSQHLLGHMNVGYMAHLGGLIAGATTMSLLLALRQVHTPDETLGRPPPDPAETARAARAAKLAPLVANAKALTDRLQLAEAAQAWEQAARVAPRDMQVLQGWLDCARYQPASEGFHAAARLIFKLPAHDPATRQWQHRAYQTYLECAKPGMRLSPGTMQQLVRNFAVAGELKDAGRLAQALSRAAPLPEGWADTLNVLVNALVKSGQVQAARGWLPVLQRDAPDEPITRWLLTQGGDGNAGGN
ncbi:MAG: rhomboid family intramembrane serine protease [Zoogloeaceae bacterium]|jgi:membrane associated rhomboid family serine protease|nr:rhomboid family intramembrane serine protease [Zoogloeaceae bacterium]